MFSRRNKKDISIFRMKKAPYLLLCCKWENKILYQTVQMDRLILAFTACLCHQYQFVILYIILTLVLLNLDIPCLCKQCRARSVGFFRSQLIWLCTVCHSVFEFISTTWIKQSDWLKIGNGPGILIYSAG